MRATLRRLQVALGIVTAASALSLIAPAAASAGTCYTVYVNGQAMTVCPGS
jgi:hypothetical protein